MPVPHVTIVILNWNGLDVLKQTLNSVQKTRYEQFEVVVADNASTDDSVAWIAQHHPEVRIIKHPDNWGFCRGNNEAIRQTSGAYVLLLNNDVEVDPGWLAPLVDRMESDARIAAVQPKLLQFESRDHFEYAGGSGGYLDRMAYPFTRGRLLFSMEKDIGQYDDARPVFWATGAALLLRRAALDEVGLLDETFYLHMEEIDLCWRLARSGYSIFVEPTSVVYHIGGSTLPQGHPDKTYYNFRNSLLMLYKNVPPKIWRRTFPQRLLLDAVAMARALLTGAPRDFAAIVKAYMHAHVMKKAYTDIRPSPSESAVLPPYQGSIVADYYFRKRRTFSALPQARFLPLSGEKAQGEIQR